MRIAFCYPPFVKNGRFANLPQNRQFIYTASREVRIFPVVMATAATWLKNLGHEVLWLDGITRRLDQSSFEKTLMSFKPDLVILESKAPIMNQTWKFIDKLKTRDQKLKTVLVGDHVTYFPEESFKKSKTDFVLTGGDWDFLLKNLVQHLQKRARLEDGIYYKTRNSKLEIRNTGKFKVDHNLNQTPVIDRELTDWKSYGEAYLFRPCAYMLFGRGCGIKKVASNAIKQSTGACTFCIWQQSLWNYTARLRSPEHVLEEVKNLVALGVKEVFDDTESGALWDYEWLKKFYMLLKKEKILGKINFCSNARGDQLDEKTCKLLTKIGYRLLKVGLESGNDKTLETICKKENLGKIVKGVKIAKDNGLRVMLTVMAGYPWEDEEDVKKTYKITRELMFYKTKAGDCLQASIITPYPGTSFWNLSVKNKWLKINPSNLEKYDMEGSILKNNINADFWCQKIWGIQKNFQFILRSGITVRNASEISLLLRGGKSLLGHIKDYAKIKQ